MSTTAVIVNHNGEADLPRCLQSLFNQTIDVDVVVVDNASSDSSLRLLRRDWPQVRVISCINNLGFAGGCNTGAGVSDSEVLLFLNPDVALPDTAVKALHDCVSRTNGVAGPAIRTESARGSIDYGENFDLLGMPGAVRSREQEPLFIQGCALAVSNDLFKRLKGFDSRYFLFAEDLEFCWRALTVGASVDVLHDVVVDHVGGASTPGGYAGERGFETSTLRFSLRERNTAAAFLACAPLPVAIVMFPLLLGKSLALAALTFISGNRKLAIALVKGVSWNIQQLNTSIERRRSSAASVICRWKALRRAEAKVFAIRTLRENGIPSIIDDKKVGIS